MLYTEWALKEPNIPTWISSQSVGALCPARLEPEFRLHSQSHGFNDILTVDQLLTPIQVIVCKIGRLFKLFALLHSFNFDSMGLFRKLLDKRQSDFGSSTSIDNRMSTLDS